MKCGATKGKCGTFIKVIHFPDIGSKDFKHGWMHGHPSMKGTVLRAAQL